MNWRLDDHRPLPVLVRRHLDRCPRCQAALADRRAMDATLRQRPAAPAIEPSPWLQGRIMAVVRQTKAAPRANFSLRWLTAGGVAVVAGVIALAQFFPAPPSPDIPPVLAVNKAEPLRVEWVRATARLTDGPTGWLANTNLNDPLQKELELVMGDVRQAWGSLKTEFVPSNLLAVNDTGP